MSNNRKASRGRVIQTIVESKTLSVTDPDTKEVHVFDNPRAGMMKQIKHAPIYKLNK